MTMYDVEMTYNKAQLYKTAVLKQDEGPFKEGEVVSVMYSIHNVLTEEFFFTCKRDDRSAMISHLRLTDFVL